MCGFFTEVDSPDPMAQHWPTVAVFFSVAALGENIGLASRLRFAHRSPLIPSQRRSWGGPPVVSIGWEVPSLRGHRLSAASVDSSSSDRRAGHGVGTAVALTFQPIRWRKEC